MWGTRGAADEAKVTGEREAGRVSVVDSVPMVRAALGGAFAVGGGT